MTTASWVITNNQTGAAIFETFSRSIADKINTAKYTAVPIGEYLGKLNAAIRNAV